MDITFDCYGTLLDTRPIRTQFMTFSARHGIDGQAAWHQFESWEDRLMYGETTLTFTTLLKRDLQYLDMTFRTNSLFSHNLTSWSTKLIKPFYRSKRIVINQLCPFLPRPKPDSTNPISTWQWGIGGISYPVIISAGLAYGLIASNYHHYQT